jgi:hypothetical protein
MGFNSAFKRLRILVTKLGMCAENKFRQQYVSNYIAKNDKIRKFCRN